MVKKENVIEILNGFEEKDFETLIKSVESACAEEDKAKDAYMNFDVTRGTVQQYRDVERKWKIARTQRLIKLTAFFDVFTGKSHHYNGRSFVHRMAAQGKLYINDHDCLAIDAHTELQRGDEIELRINGIWVPVKIQHDDEKNEWYAQDLCGLKLFGRVARKTTVPDKDTINKKINEKKW